MIDNDTPILGSRFENRDKLNSLDYNRLTRFIKEHPSIFSEKSGSLTANISNSYERVINCYHMGDKVSFLNLVEDIHYFILPIDMEAYKPSFIWDMCVKYNGNLSKVTDHDRRIQKIKTILNE